MEKMTMFILTSAAIVSLAVITVFAVNNVPSEEVYAETQVTSAVVTTVRYTLRDYNGKLALFIGDEDIPSEVYDVMTKSFGEEDREMLRRGIIVDTEEEMRGLVEDYTS